MRIPGSGSHSTGCRRRCRSGARASTPTHWQVAARAVAAATGARLVALWGADRRGRRGGFAVCAAYALAEGLVWLDLPLRRRRRGVSRLSPQFPVRGADAARRRRPARHRRRSAPRHAAVARPRRLAGRPFPLPSRPRRRRDRRTAQVVDYPFVRVDGDGVHEIPVGPVHAGIIEPGHFRFSVVGEKVLRLEERLGYTHKGIERRFTELRAARRASPRRARLGRFDRRLRLGLLHGARAPPGSTIPPRARWLRALLLERERVANHLGDLGALGNDAALAFGLAQFSRLREDWLRRRRRSSATA